MHRVNRESEGESSGIPHLAKNERDVGYPSLVREPGAVPLRLTLEPLGILLQDVVIRHPRDVVGDHAGHALVGELRLAGNR